MTPSQHPRAGFAAGLAATLCWGLLPLYFKAIKDVPPPQILAHRILWSTLFLLALLTARKGWSSAFAEVRQSGLRTFAASTALLSVNWLLYIWAVNTGRVLDASLGYFITPLVNVGLGVLMLKERLSPLQKLAIALAACGVLTLIVGAGKLPWVSLSLAFTFGFYGLLRKRLAVGPVAALFVETGLMLPFAALFLLLFASPPAFGEGRNAWLLAGTGVVTALPLIFFAYGARRLRLATVGLLQYVSPTLQFVLAVFAFGELFTRWHAVAFALIWGSLGLYSADALRSWRRG